jgi:acetylornithine deacetylase/succinyl-diaminopimelate desuccinylase-like protein
LADYLQQAGLEQVEIIETPRHPIVYAEWMQAGPQAPTVLIYGHYDLQPVDPLEKWETPPFEPTVKPGPDGDRLYARGASDIKDSSLFRWLRWRRCCKIVDPCR